MDQQDLQEKRLRGFLISNGISYVLVSVVNIELVDDVAKIIKNSFLSIRERFFRKYKSQ